MNLQFFNTRVLCSRRDCINLKRKKLRLITIAYVILAFFFLIEQQNGKNGIARLLFVVQRR